MDIDMRLATDAIIECLRDTLAKKHDGIERGIDLHASFDSFGLDSLEMVEMIEKLESTFGVELEPETAFNYPTIESLAAFLAERKLQNV